jgi:hypothetical protein
MKPFSTIRFVGVGTFTYVAIVVLSFSSGCSSQQIYNTGQAWQQNQCNRIVDGSERERCLSKVNMPYEEYKRQTEDKK